MLKTDLQLLPPHQMPDHLKCGEVYTWLCAGELYAVECNLCEDRPLCPLSEFPQHMDVWHTEWEENCIRNQEKEATYFIASESEAEIHLAKTISVDNLNNDRALSFTTEDSGLFETDDQLHSNTKNAKLRGDHKEIPEPFEQVLIEHDLAADTNIQISEELTEDEYCRDVNETATTEAEQFAIENCKQQTKTSAKHNFTLANREAEEKILTVKESEMRYLTDTTKSSGKSGVCRKDNFINKLKYLNENIANESESATSGSEKNYHDCIPTKKCFGKLTLKTKSIQQKYSKLNEIKRALKSILNDLSDYKDRDERNSEAIVKRESKNYKRNVQPKNVGIFSESELSSTEKEKVFCNRKNIFNNPKVANKSGLKTNKVPLTKFKPTIKPNNYLRKINKKPRKKGCFTTATSLGTNLEHRGSEKNANENVIEYLEGELTSSKNTIERNTDLGNSKEITKETKRKVKQKSLIENQKEQKENEFEINENEVCLSEKEIEITEKSKRDKLIRLTGERIELEPHEIVTELSENKTVENNKTQKETLFNNKQSNEIEQSADSTGTVGSGTSIKDFLINEKPKATDKLQGGKLKAVAIDIKLNPIGTSGIETIKSNLKKRIRNFLYVKRTVKKYFTRHGTRKPKDNGTKNCRNETLIDQNLTKLNLFDEAQKQSDKLVDELKVQAHTHFQATSKNQISDSGSSEYLQTAVETKWKAGQYAKCKLAETYTNEALATDEKKKKLKSNSIEKNKKIKQIFNSKETHEIETHKSILTPILRKFETTKFNTDKNLLGTCTKSQVRTKLKETNGKETLNEIMEYETPPKVAHSETTSINESRRTISECKNLKGINGTETLQMKIVCSQENDSKNIFKETNKIQDINEREKQKNMEYIMKGSSAMQRIYKSQELSKSDREETNEIEALILHNNKTNELLLPNIRKSLRNIRKKSKYLEGSLKSYDHKIKPTKSNGIETCRRKNFIHEKLTEKDKDTQTRIEFNKIQDTLQIDECGEGLNDFANCPDNSLKANQDLINRKYDQELETSESKVSQNDNESTTNSIPNMEKEIDKSKSKSTKRAVRQRLKYLGEKQKFKRTPEHGKNVFTTKNIFSSSKYFSRKSLRSYEKVRRNLRTSPRQRYKRKNSNQAEKKAPALTNSVPLCENSVQSETKKLDEASASLETSYTSEIWENLVVSLKAKDPRNVLEDRAIPEIRHKNSATAEGSTEVRISNRRNKNGQAQENVDKFHKGIEKYHLAEKPTIENSLRPTADQQKDALETINSSLLAEPLSPVSPSPQEEHFEFNQPKEKLNKSHISHLIELYHGHPRLWDQSHPDFCEPHRCRSSWQQITDEWNKYCQRKFSITEVRIRICTLCQRFVQEKDRLTLEGELDEYAKFPYYDQMKFLEHQKSLRKRRELYEQQNEKILEIYQYFPILWHVQHYKSRQAKKRAEAFESISKVLKLFGLHLSSLGIQKRIRSLRKCYRLEKIRHLHAQVEQTAHQAEFRHYERMQFLDKHIDPFVCRICGKIFENLQGFREHLEAENHGSIVEQDTDNENTFDRDEFEENMGKSIEFSPDCGQVESFAESENSTDILQRFTPFSPARENNQNLNSFALNSPKEPSLSNSWQYEDELMEDIMENVNHNDSFSQQGLDQFINSVTSCEELTNGNSLFEEVLSPSLLPAENSFIVEHPDIISDPSCSLLSPLTSPERLITVDFSTENSDLITDHSFSIPLPAEEAVTVTAEPIVKQQLQSNVGMTNPIEVIAEKPSASSALVVKVQCADYSMNLKLNTDTMSTLNPNQQDSDNDIYSSGDNSIAPLPDLLIHKMIALYRKFPQLWDPNHLDFNSRTLRRQGWINLTTEFNSIVCKQLSWRTLHRKLTDYAKYYKKLLTEQANSTQHLINKWVFYEDFKFLDDVIAVNTELQRTVHHRDNNFKIISTYKSFPQLWNIKHPEFSKRSCKQRNIELMCNRLQEEKNLQLTTERLKNRLIELRAQYRAAKKQRLKCLKNQQQFVSDEFEFYEALNFLDDHIDPFICNNCHMEFKKLTDYNQHLKKEHSPKKRLMLVPAETCEENVCHICGIKFTTRSNLLHHIKRHEGIRNYACTMCPKKFYASHALKVHTRSHTKECPYTCEKCGMSFVSASKLNQHVKRHLNQKDFECSYCPKTFFTAFEKDRHERRHLNIRDKVCPNCGKTFVAGSSYYAHLMLHSDKKRFECDKCDMKFAQYPGLFKHKKRHHTS